MRTPLARFDWNPLGGLWQIQDELSRAFDGARSLVPAPASPALEVWASEEGLRVRAELPGVAPDAVSVSIEGERLLLSGTRPEPEVPEGYEVVRRERRTGPFSRAIELPFRVDADRVEARLEAGVLELVVPRSEEEKPKRIQIRTTSGEGPKEVTS